MTDRFAGGTVDRAASSQKDYAHGQHDAGGISHKVTCAEPAGGSVSRVDPLFGEPDGRPRTSRHR